MRSLLQSLFANKSSVANSSQNVVLITNFTSCKLGIALLEELSKHPSTTLIVAMAHNAENVLSQHQFSQNNKITAFDGFPNEQEDRNRLIAFLKEKDIKVKTIVQN